MRRSRRVVTATSLTVGVLAAALVGWFAAPSIAQTQIQVLDREGPYEKDVDLGKVGTSPGDVSFESHPLVDPSDGTTVVGRDFERVTIFKILSGGDDLDFVYDSTLRLNGSDIVVYGEGRYSDIFTPDGLTISVVGGTGAFAGVRGTATVAATQKEGEFLITIDLIAP
jgi:hypothetical protein